MSYTVADTPTENDGPEQVDVLLRLLSEYTSKLKRTVRTLNKVESQRYYWTVMGILVLVVLSLSTLAIAAIHGFALPKHLLNAGGSSISDRFLVVLSGTLTIANFIAAAAALRFNHLANLRHTLLWLDVKTSVLQLEKLVRHASQFEEHVFTTHSQRLQLDLKLADAEATIANARATTKLPHQRTHPDLPAAKVSPFT